MAPAKIVIGRKQVNGVTGAIATVSNSTEYKLTVVGTDGVEKVVTITSASSATAANIITALKTAFDTAAPVGVTMTNNGDSTFSIDLVSAGSAWSVKSSSNIDLTKKASTETWPDAIAAVEQANNEWIALNTSTHTDSDILAIAGAIEAREKVYITSTSAAAVKSSVTTDIASQLKALGYQKTAIMWKADADTAYPECAWTGYQLQYTPGSNTWANKTLTGTAVDSITSSETTNLLSKNVNTYESIGGVNATTNGKMVGGEFIDIMVGILWLTARLRERIWFRLVNLPKIAYTAQGIAIIEAEVRAQLQEGIRNNFLADNPRPVISVPDVLSVDPNLRATRTLEDLTFEARLAGALHYVKIRGTVK